MEVQPETPRSRARTRLRFANKRFARDIRLAAGARRRYIRPMDIRALFRFASAIAMLTLIAGCTMPGTRPPSRKPSEVRAEIVRLLPPSTDDRAGWAADIATAFGALDIEPDTSNLCATLAVIGQESGYASDPVVPNLGRIARAEIDRRAAGHDVPQLLVRAALSLKSSDGRSYSERIAAVRTERELSLVYEDLIGKAPMGRRLFAGANPVHTGGPMQVGIAFAEQEAREADYPYPIEGSIRHEVFTRRGGVYFGIAHLLAYRASYDRMIYRFADYNAGLHASRNAAFQNAVAIISGKKLALDGDLVSYDSREPGATERAVRSIARVLDVDEKEVRAALEKGERSDFDETALYARVFERADRIAHKRLARAMIPRITLKSPKIRRKLTTEWFANRVDQRYRACLAKAGR
jgi:hypothetical protein